MRRRAAAPIRPRRTRGRNAGAGAGAHGDDLAVRLEAPHLIDRTLQDHGDLARDQVWLPAPFVRHADTLRVMYRADGALSRWALDPPPRGAEPRASATAAPRVASARNWLCDPGAPAERVRWR